MVTYEELQQLIAFSKTNTLADVAEQFHISQPSVTRNMKKIETELGVALFDRTKNSITLNETGLCAVDESIILVKQMEDMMERVRDYDRKKRTVSLGSCAAVPVSDINRQLMRSFPESTVVTNLKPIEELLSGLEDDTYQLIILPFSTKDKKYCEKEIGHENLMFYLPKSHPLANSKVLHLSDLDGENILLYEKIGFWYDIVVNKMPHSKFLMQNERYTFLELINNSILPCFATNVIFQTDTLDSNRIAIPIADPEVNVTYYLVCKKENRNRFSALF